MLRLEGYLRLRFASLFYCSKYCARFAIGAELGATPQIVTKLQSQLDAYTADAIVDDDDDVEPDDRNKRICGNNNEMEID